MEFKEDKTSKLSKLILRFRLIAIVLVLLIIIGGGAYATFSYVQDKKTLKVLEKIEDNDILYKEIFVDNDFYTPESELDKDKITRAITQLDEVTEEFTSTFGVQEAYYRKGRLYLLEKEMEKAQIEFETALTKGKNTSYLAPKILMYLAAISEELGNINEAQMYYQRIIDNYPTNVEFPHALINLGRIAETRDIQENTNTAQGYYLSLTENNQWNSSQWASLAKSRLAALGYTAYTKNEDNTSDE